MHFNVDLSYPRPLCRRKSFIDLNGEWDFYLEDYDVGEKLPRYKSFPKNHLKIKVPFCYQSELSGINIGEETPLCRFPKCDVRVYLDSIINLID